MERIPNLDSPSRFSKMLELHNHIGYVIVRDNLYNSKFRLIRLQEARLFHNSKIVFNF